MEIPLVEHPQVDRVLVFPQPQGLYHVILVPKSGPLDPVAFEVEPGAPLYPLYSTGAQGPLVAEAVAAVLYGLDQDIENAKFELLWDGEDCEINRYDGYAEPGYSLGEGKTGVALANWNHFSAEFQSWVEDVKGYVMEWSDEWIECVDCNRIFRTQPDSYSWTQYGTFAHGGTCGDCVKKDAVAYLRGHEGKARQAMTIDIDPVEHGYLLVNPVNREFESGFHPGQTDDPQRIAAQLVLQGATRWLFKITGKGQFDIEFAVYLHEDDKAVLDACRKELFG